MSEGLEPISGGIEPARPWNPQPKAQHIGEKDGRPRF